MNRRRVHGQTVLVFTILFTLIGIPSASKTYCSQAQSKQPRRPFRMLVLAGKDSLKKLIARDELQTKRPCMCDQVGKGDDIICLWAGAFHPHVQGADLYFRSITKE